MVLEMMVACVQSHYKTDVHHSVLRHFNKDVVFPIYSEQKVSKHQIIRAFRSWHMGFHGKIYFVFYPTCLMAGGGGVDLTWLDLTWKHSKAISLGYKAPFGLWVNQAAQNRNPVQCVRVWLQLTCHSSWRTFQKCHRNKYAPMVMWS